MKETETIRFTDYCQAGDTAAPMSNKTCQNPDIQVQTFPTKTDVNISGAGVIAIV